MGENGKRVLSNLATLAILNYIKAGNYAVDYSSLMVRTQKIRSICHSSSGPM